MTIVFDELDKSALADLLFATNLTYREIAEKLHMTEVEVGRQTKLMGLSWLRKKRGYASRGQAALTQIMRKLLPGEEVVSEYPLGERLRLDIYCPRFKIAVEYHGHQHFEFVEFFHKDLEGWKDHQERDLRKADLCREKGIILVAFRYNDELTEDAVFKRILFSIENAPVAPEGPPKRTLVGNPYYEAMKQRNREYRRETYRKMKKARSS